MSSINIQKYIRIVPDFPKEGISFYDIATLLQNHDAWRETISKMAERIISYEPDIIFGIESRGFLVASPLALEINCAIGMIRKSGKLPGKTLSYRYTLEYGEDEIELQPDLIPQGAKIVIVDDLLATGGTLQAAETLVKNAGGNLCAHACIIELDGLGGRDKLSAPLEALLNCPA